MVEYLTKDYEPKLISEIGLTPDQARQVREIINEWVEKAVDQAVGVGVKKAMQAYNERLTKHLEEWVETLKKEAEQYD